MSRNSAIIMVFVGAFHFFGAVEVESNYCPKREPTPAIQANLTCDQRLNVFVDGKQVGHESQSFKVVDHYTIPPDARVLAVRCHSGIKQASIDGGILGSLDNGLITNDSWRCLNSAPPGWAEADFDDSSWPIAVKHGINSPNAALSFPWLQIANITVGAWWIWTKDNQVNDSTVYCRLLLRNDSMDQCIVDRKSDLFHIDTQYINRSLYGSIIMTITTPSSTECALRCQRVSQCASFNFEYAGVEAQKLCELNSKTVQESNSLIDRRGFVYFNSVVH